VFTFRSRGTSIGDGAAALGQPHTDGYFQCILYGNKMADECTCGGYTISTQVPGGLWYGAKQYMEPVHITVDSDGID
jgi:hypothetical protein